MKKHPLAGRWKLIEYKFEDQNGNVFLPLGENLSGMVLIDEGGYLSAQLMGAGRKPFVVGAPTPEEAMAAYSSYIAYCGPTRMDEDKGIFTTTVESALDPSWVGGEQVRHIEFTEDRMTLKTDPMEAGDASFTGTFRWERKS